MKTKKTTPDVAHNEKGTPVGEMKRPGPAKEKTQVTLRLDKQLMSTVINQIKQDNTRITDIIERSLILALNEARYMPKWTSQVRFMVSNATKDQEKLLRGLLIAMVEGEVVDRKSKSWEFETMCFEFCKRFLETRNEQPHAVRCLDLYSRYGKSPEEIAQLRA